MVGGSTSWRKCWRHSEVAAAWSVSGGESRWESGGSDGTPPRCGRRQGTSIGQSDETEAGFEACDGGKCHDPSSQLQNTPYQVWCRASTKTNTFPGCTAQGCRCHLYWKKKSGGDWEYGGDQNEKKGIKDEDGIYKSKYDYQCRCQKARAGGSATVDDAAQALPDLTSTFVRPDGFILEQGKMILDLGNKPGGPVGR